MIHSAPQINAATLRTQGFGAFFGQSCDRDRFLSRSFSLVFLSLDFIAISDCVFNNKNNYVFGHTGYQIIITILVISSTPSLYANLRVATRVYDVECGVIFSKNSTFVFSDGAAWTPRLRSPYRPRLWLLLQTHGTAMGTKMAVAFADIFMAKIERQILRQSSKTPLVWKRCIDDVFSLWDTSVEKN